MVENIGSTIQKASKIYEDDGYEWIREGIENKVWEYSAETFKLTPKSARPSISEYKALARFKKDPNRSLIAIGDIYVKQINKFDGRLLTFRMKKELFDIAVKYNFFPADY